jgi:hypothetical protein
MNIYIDDCGVTKVKLFWLVAEQNPHILCGDIDYISDQLQAQIMGWA